jgi:hypothetical protein
LFLPNAFSTFSVLKVNGIPSFVLIDCKTGDLITTDGRSKISADPTGENFPWKV